ncbi:MAG: HPr(Ser) kinase/phosphatase [Gammaproteobacteria bacterium]
MTIDASISTLFDALHDKLELRWLDERRGHSRSIINPADLKNDASAIGFLNLIHQHRIQILGTKEVTYLQTLHNSARDDLINRLFSDDTDLIVFANSEPIPDDFRQRAAATGIPVFLTDMPSHHLLDYMRYYLENLFAEKTTLHGVFMEIFSLGALITGSASVGKSELALELIARGHRLVADDAPEFSKTSPDSLTGSCPEILQDCLEVRGLGILDVRTMFGDSAIKRTRKLRLIIKLEAMSKQKIHQIDRFSGSLSNRTILGIEIPEITLPVTPGRNLAVLAEAAARNHTLRLKGYDSTQQFLDRHEQMMKQADNNRRGER